MPELLGYDLAGFSRGRADVWPGGATLEDAHSAAYRLGLLGEFGLASIVAITSVEGIAWERSRGDFADWSRRVVDQGHQRRRWAMERERDQKLQAIRDYPKNRTGS